MMKDFRYRLEKGSKKHRCPECNRKTFVRFIDNHSGEYLPYQYGRCDREEKCSYFLNPYKDGYSEYILEHREGHYRFPKILSRPKSLIHTPSKPKPFYFDLDTFKATLDPKRYEENSFLQNLMESVSYPFSAEEITRVVELYKLGTVVKGYMKGAITFPFIDRKGNIRAIQVKKFNQENHTTRTSFLHSIIAEYYAEKKKPLPEWLKDYKNNEKLITCLFGEDNLDRYPSNRIALVEAPKTAIYCTLYLGFPDQVENFLWLAVFNKSSLTFDKISVLRGREVYLFPDLSKDGSTMKEWEEKVKKFRKLLPDTTIKVSDILENRAPDEYREIGGDLADYLINFNHKLFKEPDQQPAVPVLNMEDILIIQTETHTSKRFKNLIIAWIKTKQGKNYELLFSKDRNLLPYGEIKETVDRLGKFFNKNFMPIKFDNGIYYSNTFS